MPRKHFPSKLKKCLAPEEEILYHKDLTFKTGALGKIALTIVGLIVVLYFFYVYFDGGVALIFPTIIGIAIIGAIWSSLRQQKIYGTNYRLIKTLKGGGRPYQFEEVPYKKINGLSFKTIWNRSIIATGIVIILLPLFLSYFSEIREIFVDYWYLLSIIYILTLIGMFVFGKECKLVIKISGGKGFTGTSDIIFPIKGRSTIQNTPLEVTKFVQEMRENTEEGKIEESLDEETMAKEEPDLSESESGNDEYVERNQETIPKEEIESQEQDRDQLSRFGKTDGEKKSRKKQPPPRPEVKTQVPTCPNCGNQMRYIEKHDRWYCDSCQEYK